MYDELVKRLHRYSENCVAYKLDADFASAVQEAADAIEELSRFKEDCDACGVKTQSAIESLQKKIQCWIPVTEEPPLKVGDDGYNGYLIYANGHYEVADYTTDKFDNVPYFHVDGEYEPDATHWMPLPEPPTAEEGET